MISTRGSRPSFFTRAAASQIARTCIAYRPGFTMPSRTPRRPSMGFASWSSFTFWSTRFCSATSSPRSSPSATSTASSTWFGQELVQRRVQEPHGHRQPGHRAEDADEVLALEREQDVVRGLLLGLGLGEDHLLHGLRRAPSPGTCARCGRGRCPRRRVPRVRRLVGRVGVRADAEPPDARPRPPSAPRTPSRSSRSRAAASPDRAFWSSDSLSGASPTKTFPVKPSIVMTSPSCDRGAVRPRTSSRRRRA